MTSLAVSSLGSIEGSSSVGSNPSNSQLSLPSSFKMDGAMDNEAIESYSLCNESDDISETQLALRKEVKPMMHLLRLLKEMDDDEGSGASIVCCVSFECADS